MRVITERKGSAASAPSKACTKTRGFPALQNLAASAFQPLARTHFQIPHTPRLQSAHRLLN